MRYGFDLIAELERFHVLICMIGETFVGTYVSSCPFSSVFFPGHPVTPFRVQGARDGWVAVALNS